ncbi:MAG: hypothetical protein HC769_27560, partial [Cyanobacteria bacterium CRU_2_1]|nr:hypothetical protein [Cyanobacteria bacterium CRU_2_1]
SELQRGSFLPNPNLPDDLCKQREDWSETTWYTAWESICEPYGGAVFTCKHCNGTGKVLTPEGQQIAELNQFLKLSNALEQI